MLPSFPESQDTLDKAWNERMFARRAEAFPSSVSPRIKPILEGRLSDFQRDDGSVKPFEPKLRKVTLSYDSSDGKGLSFEVFEQKARELGEMMGNDHWEMLFEVVDEAVAETGNEIKIKNGEIQKEDFLRMIEVTAMSFDQLWKSSKYQPAGFVWQAA